MGWLTFEGEVIYLEVMWGKLLQKRIEERHRIITQKRLTHVRKLQLEDLQQQVSENPSEASQKKKKKTAFGHQNPWAPILGYTYTSQVRPIFFFASPLSPHSNLMNQEAALWMGKKPRRAGED